jgi:hypothetical protein
MYKGKDQDFYNIICNTNLTQTLIQDGRNINVFLKRYDMNGRFQMQGGKNWILPTEMNANRFFWDAHWLKI